MFQTERCDRILELLQQKKNLSLEKLCRELFCSPATVRRDLIELEKMGLVVRRRGGVSLVMSGNNEYSYTFRDMANREAKQFICSLADNFLADGMSIFMDSSSTVLNMCPFIKAHSRMTVVTNGISTAFNLIENECADTYIAGGHIKTGSTSVVGEHAGEFIGRYKADLAILSCRGMDGQGVYEANQEQALVKQQMLKNAKQTILLCDAGKFGQSFFYRLTGFQSVSAVLTDKKPADEICEEILAAGCEILY